MMQQYSMNSFKFPSQNNTKDISSIIEDSERHFLTYIVQMYDVLNKENIDLKKFGDILDAIMILKNTQEKDYIDSLIRPEKAKGCKIPSRIPIPSVAFQLKHTINVSTNSSGNVAIAFNPTLLTDSTSSVAGTFFINNDSSLTGTASSDFFTCRDVGQGIPPVYNSQRLVSASIVVKYIGSIEATQGVIGGGIIYDKNIGFSVFGTNHTPLAKYGDFNLIRDSLFHQENHLSKGIRIIHLPVDNSNKFYFNLGSYLTGTVQFIYVTGGPPSSSVLKVNIFSNFECIPDASFLNYIPTSTASPIAIDNEKVIKSVKNNIVTEEAVSNETNDKNPPKSTFDSVVETLGVVIPSVIDIAKIVLMFI